MEKPDNHRILINSAPKDQLLTVDGVGDVMADNIITLRKMIPLSAQILGTMTGFRTDMLSAFDFSVEVSSHEQPSTCLKSVVPSSIPDNTDAQQSNGGNSLFQRSMNASLDASHLQQNCGSVSPNRNQGTPNLINGYGTPRRDHTRQNNIPDIHTRDQSKQSLTIPRNMSFDGNSSWRNFWQRFLSFVNQHELTDIQSILYYFSFMLEGKASQHFENQRRRKDFFTIESIRITMEGRFDTMETSQSALIQLLEIRQYEGEEVRDYADRIWELAEKAYPTNRIDEIERHVILAFARGLKNRGAAQFIMCQNFETMNRALQCYIVYTESQAVVPTTSRDDRGYVIRNVHSNEYTQAVPMDDKNFLRNEVPLRNPENDRYRHPSESKYRHDRGDQRYPEVTHSVNRVQSHSKNEMGELKKLIIEQGRIIERQNILIEGLCNRMAQMERGMGVLIDGEKKRNQPFGNFRTRSPSPSGHRLRSPSPSGRRTRSPSGSSLRQNQSAHTYRGHSKSPVRAPSSYSDDGTCFLCHAYGHFAAECPDRKVTFQSPDKNSPKNLYG